MTIDLPDLALLLLFGTGEETGLAAARMPGGPLIPIEDVGRRLAGRQTTIVDASDLSGEMMKRLSRLAADHYVRAYTIAIGATGAEQVRRAHVAKIAASFTVPSARAVVPAVHPLPTDRRGEVGPFDLVGDVHGCIDELVDLLAMLGYRVRLDGRGPARRAIVDALPAGRRAFFVGDLVDRGPNSPDVLRVVMALVEAGAALCVLGNHDFAFLRWLDGGKSGMGHGLEQTATQFAAEPERFRHEVAAFLHGLQSHLWVDGGALAVAHAGVRQEMIGRATGKVKSFGLYGDTDPGPGPDGLPKRYHWALEHGGETAIVYGHTPVPDVGWVNNTACIDTGCCYGGRLTALRWPERRVLSVPARAIYWSKAAPFGHPPARPRSGSRG